MWPFASAAPAYDAARDGALTAVVVPTAGSYRDAAGRWWPDPGSIRRVARAQALQRRLGIPLILTGGAPLPGQPPEAVIIARHLGLGSDNVVIEPTARNSAESGAAVAARIAHARPPRVLLVTSNSHQRRMVAALRRHGVEVFLGADATPSLFATGVGLIDFIPSNRGLGLSRSASLEYFALAWYLVRGDIRPGDL